MKKLFFLLFFFNNLDDPTWVFKWSNIYFRVEKAISFVNCRTLLSKKRLQSFPLKNMSKCFSIRYLVKETGLVYDSCQQKQ